MHVCVCVCVCERERERERERMPSNTRIDEQFDKVRGEVTQSLGSRKMPCT